ncbi:MAG: hypothetical protein PVF32_20445 [Desulfobacterales bacterium]|jgi:DNA-binding Lrp family transcriptional regulator
MNERKYLVKIDKIILDIISHFGTISIEDLWYELGESGDLKEQPMTEDEVLRRLEFLAAKDLVKSEGDEWVIKE